MKLIVISGRSGSGKSAALNALEDAGVICIDNLPASLLPTLMDRLKQNTSDSTRHLAVGIDVRNPWSDLQNIESILGSLGASGVDYHVIYLDADTRTLIKRFSESRRKHPLTNEQTALTEALQREKEMLHPIEQIAEEVIDTSHMSPHELSNLLRQHLNLNSDVGLQLLFESFGFKHGLPGDADLVFDIRCLPNPHWRADLRPLTGLDSAVADYLKGEPLVEQMLDDIQEFVLRWLPHFESSNRSYLTVAIGCTGGQHRSVYLCERLKERFGKDHKNVQVRHRELSQ